MSKAVRDAMPCEPQRADEERMHVAPEARLHEGATYYGQPVLKQPTWKPYIPTYFYLGGLAAGSSLLAAGAEMVGDARLARVTKLTALGAITGSAGALVADLGRPSRFHHMLRVFRPSSPMNVGSWLLGAYGPAAGVAALATLFGRPRALGRLATLSAAALAPPVATYTAVLLSETAVPAWHGIRKTLPALFAAGAAASAGGTASLLVPESRPAQRFAITGATAEIVLSAGTHRTLPDEVARAYSQGAAHMLRRTATYASVAGTLLVGAGKRSRSLTRVGASAIVLGALAERFAVVQAGRASARDPQATVAPQRRRIGGAAG